MCALAGHSVLNIEHGMDLIPGLPSSLVESNILSRVLWKDLPSVLSVNKSWHSSLRFPFSKNPCQKHPIIAVIHPASSQKVSYAVSVYDSEVEKWELLPAIPGLPCGAPMAGRCISVQGHLFVLGGRNPITWEFMSDVFSLNVRSLEKVWTRRASMTTARSNFACVATGDKILVAGGQGDNALALASAEIYDSRCERWEEIPQLSIPRNHCVGAVVENGQVVIHGGYVTLSSSSSPTEYSLCCLENTDSVTIRWDASAEAILLGCRRWQTVEAAPFKKALQRSLPSIVCGQLPCIHKQAVETLYEKCGNDWTIVEGKLALKAMNEESGNSLVLGGLIHREHVFGTKYWWSKDVKAGDGDSSLRVSFCRGVFDPASRESQTWKELWCPFDFGSVPLSCCFL